VDRSWRSNNSRLYLVWFLVFGPGSRRGNVGLVRCSLLFLILLKILPPPLLDPSSMSWRVPLGIQLIPAVILALGCAFVLPPSPRLLVLQGNDEAASKALSLLRRGTSSAGESDTDVLVQLELLEMRVETEVVRRVLARELELEYPTRRETGLREEWKAWKKLFSERYRDRTWIGVLVMVFQRLFRPFCDISYPG